jgi:ubiquinone biosynthesis protein UbiJ
MQNIAFNLVAGKLFNHVLSDYPKARELLAAHAGKSVSMAVGPVESLLRIAPDGAVELVGEGDAVAADVSVRIPPRLLSRLARREAAAFGEVEFTGDGEFAAALLLVLRQAEWNIEEDLSRLIGDIAAHRVIASLQSAGDWTADAKARFMENLAEYLSEERQAFITKTDLETLATKTERLRDDVARLEARLSKLNQLPP